MSRPKIVAAMAVGIAVVGAGAAIAARQLESPGARSQAIINDAAGQLGVQPSQLTSALKKAIENQIDAEVRAGQLSKEQGDALKQKVESGTYPLVGGLGPGFGLGFGPGHHGFGGFADLDVAATYLGLTVDQLRTDLQGGKTLAQVATAQGKTADGLVQALVDSATKQLDAAVTAGKLTQAQEQSLQANLKQRLTDLVNGVRPGPATNAAPMFHGRFGRGGGRWQGRSGGGLPSSPSGVPPQPPA